MKKKIPKIKNDKQAERFIETADLTDYDLSAMKSARFEISAKDARVNMRIPEKLLGAVKKKAAQMGVPYQRFIRHALEEIVTR